MSEDEDDFGSEDDQLLRKLKRWQKDASSHWSKWRVEARQAYDFVAGNQWADDDKAKLLEEMRQPITFNRIGPMVDAVTGAEILNRQEVRFSPREIGDVQVNEIMSSANDWARDQTDAEDEESDAFYDGIVCGMGWTETRMDYEESPEGLIRIDRVDPLEMWPDPSARKRNLADRRFQIRGRYWNGDELPRDWRDKVQAAGDDGDISTGYSETSKRDDYEEGPAEGEAVSRDGKVWILHYQWYETEPAYRVMDEATQKTAVMSADEYKQTVMQYMQVGMRPPQAAKIKRRQYYQAFVANDIILQTGPIAANRFTFTCITGKRDRNRGTWYGIVRAMIDPQMWANKWLSQILHILNTSAKGGVIYEEGAVSNPRELLEEWAKPDGAIKVKPGTLAGGKIQERKAANYPAGLDKLMDFAVNSMPQVSGINLELLGLVQREQAGVLESQRKQAGYAILATFFDSLRRYRKIQGRIMLDYIQRYLSDGRLIRITGNQGNAQYVPLIRQGETVEYDVIVDEAPMSANQKEAVWAMMTQMLPILSKQPVPMEIWQTFLRYSPLPSSVSAELSQALGGGDQPPSPQEQAQAELMALEVEEKRAGVEKTRAETAKIMQEAGGNGDDVRLRADMESKAADNARKGEAHAAQMAQINDKRRMSFDKHDMEMLARAASIKQQREKQQAGSDD